MISINQNLAANSVSKTLSSHYGRLQTSTERLSSGLRINGAADDAAGLAIRELMRSDIAALRQGMRNANDAISMLQTMDGALGVIDEKLIRMKELAEQAATGTYDSTQRLMIDSEFQAMGAEIDRIARATDFNGIKLLCTPMKTWYTDEEQFVVTNSGSISGLALPAGINGNPVLSGIDPKRYINENNPTKTISISLKISEGTDTKRGNLALAGVNGTSTEYQLVGSDYSMAYVSQAGNIQSAVISYDGTTWTVTDNNGPFPTVGFSNGGTQVTAIDTTDMTNIRMLVFSLGKEQVNRVANPVDLEHMDESIKSFNIDVGNLKYEIQTKKPEITTDPADTEYTAFYNENNNTITVNLAGGGRATMRLDDSLNIDDIGEEINFDINMAGEMQTVQVEHKEPDPDQKVKIHFGPMNDSAEDYYYINYANCTREGLGIDDLDIQTQDNAQNALVDINEAIVKKDKVRANFGAMQNRFENTLSNLSIQAENLQAAESRISDAEIATEMMNFVRNQILTQSAVAMLAQANSLPQMVMALIH